MRRNPHFDLYTDRRGDQLFDVTPKEWRADVKVMDQVERPGGRIGTLAEYGVTPDAPLLHRAWSIVRKSGNRFCATNDATTRK